MALTGKQTRFIAEYLIDLNATQAAIRAGYSKKTAHVIGPENLGKPAVMAALSALQAERAKRTAITFEWVAEELRRVAAASLKDVTRWGVGKVTIGFDADGKRLPSSDLMDAAMMMEVEQAFVTPLNSDDLEAEQAAAVSEVSLGKDGFKVKMHDKLAALDKLARMHGYYAPDKVMMTGAAGGPVAVDVTLTPAEAYRKLIGGA